MSRLHELITTITKDGKLSNEAIIKHLTCAISESENEDEEYIELYKEAYGESLNKEEAERKVMAMAVTDGSDRSTGQKWTFETTTDVATKHGINFQKYTKVDWYFVLNMVYSDYYATAKKFELEENAEFYVSLARDWLNDADSGCTPSEKVFRYVFDVIEN